MSTDSALPERNPLVLWENLDSRTGRCANTDPLLDRLNLDEKGASPMHIVREADSTATPPPKTRFAERMARADGCPDCVVNYSTPSSTYDDGPDGFLANYVCESCGNAWTTAWKD